MENVQKGSKRVRRIRGKYLSVYGEIANWGYLRFTKSSPNMKKVFKRIRRIRRKNLCVHGEDAKRLLTHSPNTQKDMKVGLSRLLIMRILNFLDSFYPHYMGWIKPKNHLTQMPL
jgi:hypothetical protein